MPLRAAYMSSVYDVLQKCSAFPLKADRDAWQRLRANVGALLNRP
jgi:hypothetical protein